MKGKQLKTNSSAPNAGLWSKLPLKGLVGVLLMLFFVIYTATKFPYTYITMEGDNFWVLTRDFWHQELAELPAVTTWLADFLTQFYSSPHVAATIEAFLLGITGVLAYLTLSRFKGDPSRKKGSPRGKWSAALPWLALLPPVLLGFYCTFDLNFHLQCLFFFALLALQLFSSIRGKVIWSIVCVPLGFLLMRTPLLIMLLLIQTVLLALPRENRKRAAWMGVPLLLLFLTPLIYSQQVAFIPFEERYTDWGTRFEPLTSKESRYGEYVKMLVCLAEEERWEELLYKAHARREAQRGNSIVLRYALLAESALGTLPENLLEYPISDERLFLYQHEGGRVALPFNRLFYRNLGVYDEAFHHAQEYGLLMHTGTCFSSIRQMTDYSIAEGEWEMAEKFLHILSKSSCHKDFVKDRQAKIPNPHSLIPNSSIPLRADNFVGGYPLPVEMLKLERYYKDSPHRKKMIDYAICTYIIRGDFKSFTIAINNIDIYKGRELPKAYRVFQEKYLSAASSTSPVSNPLETR